MYDTVRLGVPLTFTIYKHYTVYMFMYLVQTSEMESQLHLEGNSACPNCTETRNISLCPGYLFPCIIRKRLLNMKNEFEELISKVCIPLINEAPADAFEILKTTFQNLEFSLIFEVKEIHDKIHNKIKNSLEDDGMEYKMGRFWLRHKVIQTLTIDCTFQEMLEKMNTKNKYNFSPHRFHMLVFLITKSLPLNLKLLLEMIYTLDSPLNFVPLLYFSENDYLHNDNSSESILLNYCVLYEKNKYKFGGVISAIISFRYRLLINMLCQIIECFNPQFNDNSQFLVKKLLIKNYFDGIFENMVQIIVTLLKFQNSSIAAPNGEKIPMPQYFHIPACVEKLSCHSFFNLVFWRTSLNFVLQLVRIIFFIYLNFRIIHSGHNISTFEAREAHSHYAFHPPNKLEMWLFKTFLQDPHLGDGFLYLIKSCVEKFDLYGDNNDNIIIHCLLIPGVIDLTLTVNCLLNELIRESPNESYSIDHFSDKNLENIKQNIFSIQTLPSDIQTRIRETVTDPAWIANCSKYQPMFFVLHDYLRTDQIRRKNLSQPVKINGLQVHVFNNQRLNLIFDLTL